MRLLQGKVIYRLCFTRRLASSNSEKVSEAWTSQGKEDEKFRGLDLVRSIEKQAEPDCPYPILRRLGIATTGRTHSLSAGPEDVVKYIKLGAINKNLAIQYCHYLAHVCRTCEQENSRFYTRRVLDLMLYLLRNANDLPRLTLIKLLGDVSDTDGPNCMKICDETIEQFNLATHLTSKDYIKLLTSCYKFGLWSTANKLVCSTQELKVANIRLFDDLVQGLNRSSMKYSEDDLPVEEKQKLKEDVIQHLLTILELSCKDRSQFITKYNQEFIQSLERFGLKVTRNPNLKMSGRCTSCDTHIPTYDGRTTTAINDSLKRLLSKQIEHRTKVHLHMVPEELSKFENFLQETFRIDNKPIDCVIDGLNVAYKNSSGYNFHTLKMADNVERTIKTHSPDSQSRVLINTIIRGNMLKLFKKLLVIGRHHMTRWPGLMDFFDKNRIHFFATADNAKDDLLQLFAATCHPKTVLISNDFFRDHVALLDGEERIRLERWIDTHQGWILNKNLKPIWPTPYEKIASVNKTKGYFHVPIIDYHKLENIAQHEPPPHLNTKMITWICVNINESEGSEGPK